MRPDGTSRFAFVFVVAALVAGSPPAFAQTFPLALDVVGAVDGVRDRRQRGTRWCSSMCSRAVRLAEGLDFIARPVISRRSFDGTWQKQMYQLGVRYERPASGARGVGLRLEVGQLPSPIGIAMLENRPDLNPLVSQHSAYYMPLPRVDPEMPRRFLIARCLSVWRRGDRLGAAMGRASRFARQLADPWTCASSGATSRRGC